MATTGRQVELLPTGAANTASMRVALERLGARVRVAETPDAVRGASRLVVPGVGSFGAAVARLRRDGLLSALAERLHAGRRTLLVCLGLQLLAERSEESPDARGLGLLPGVAGPFPAGLRSPQQGWNRVEPERGCRLVAPGHAYFSNGFRLTSADERWDVAWSEHGGRFVAALERGAVLACQFHPELSGAWGADLLERWLTMGPQTGPEAAGLHAGRGRSLQRRTSQLRPLGRPAERLREAPGTMRRGAAPRPLQGSSGSTLATRLIPCLDVRDGRVVKGVRFDDLQDAGDPAELAARYAAEGADELALLDVSATPEGRATAARTVRAVREVLLLPLTVGGGVRCVDDALRLLDAGADKVAVNTAAVESPELLTALASRCGRQCVVVAVDAARSPVSELGEPARAIARGRASGVAPDARPGAQIQTRTEERQSAVAVEPHDPHGSGWRVIVRSGSRLLDLDAVAWCRSAVAAGAGEILLTSWDRDGTGDGYDEELIAAVRAAVDVPVIASGGAGRAEHLAGAVSAGADAVLLASRLHRGELSIAELKSFLAQRGVEVRP